jgi:F-type H+-transporting ATPase subunit c
MGIQTYKALDAVARQPEASNKIRTILMIGLAFTETTAIYGLFIAIMLVINIL